MEFQSYLKEVLGLQDVKKLEIVETEPAYLFSFESEGIEG